MKKRKLNVIGRIMIIILFIALIVCVYFLLNKKDEELNLIAEGDNYTLKIDYPTFDNKELDKQVREYIDGQKKEFIEMVKGLSIIADSKYYFTATYQVNEIKDIQSIHVLIYSYSGGNHDIRNDKTYHYNTKDKEIVNLSYFLDNNDSLSKVSTLSYYYVTKYFEGKDVPERMIKDGTEAILENYEHFTFLEEGLQILFPPYQVAPWSDGEIKILIPYSELNGIIKKEFHNVIVEEEPDITINTRDIESFKDKKLLAFTFDDGPSNATTNKLLDKLDLYQARVTFFVLGSRINQNKDVLIRAYEQGNQIGSHTYNHRDLLKVNDASLISEIKDTNDAIKKVIGVEPTLIRPPYGNTNSHIKELGKMHTILWNVDTLDWKFKDKNKIANEIIKNAKDGAIILLHDIYQSSVDGALIAMEKLQKEGYAFVTIEEMAKLKNVSLDSTKSYFNFK